VCTEPAILETLKILIGQRYAMTPASRSQSHLYIGGERLLLRTFMLFEMQLLGHGFYVGELSRRNAPIIVEEDNDQMLCTAQQCI
jgi:hypothetical protein